MRSFPNDKKVAFEGFLGCFFQNVESYQQIGNEIDKQQLPGREIETLFNQNCDDQKNGCSNNEQNLPFRALVVMMLVMMMFVCHNVFASFLFLIDVAKVRQVFCNLVAKRKRTLGKAPSSIRFKKGICYLTATFSPPIT